MKKVYSKPEIMFEDFTLTTNVASGCDVPTNLPSQNECGMDFSGVVVFMTGMTGCTGVQIDPTAPNGDGEYNGICYHVFSDERNIFAS